MFLGLFSGGALSHALSLCLNTEKKECRERRLSVRVKITAIAIYNI